jgi:hypothetical protein
MRFAPAVLAAVLLVGCAPDEEAPPAEAPAMEEAAPAAAPAMQLADFAGTWQNTATLEGVADPVASTMTGTAAGNDWTMSLEGRPNIPMTVSVQGDSLIAESAEYESILRAGVMVRTRTASVLQNGELVGNLTATYKTQAGEEVVKGTIRGTRQQ